MATKRKRPAGPFADPFAMRVALWIERLSVDALDEHAIGALRARHAAIREGAPARALARGDRLLDEMRDARLTGGKAKRKLEAAERAYWRAYEGAYRKRVKCPMCGTLVQPSKLQRR